MDRYKFETDQLGISDNGIHLLRSRFNYKTIDFESIDEIRITKGRQINNWLLTLAFGIALLSIGLYVLYHVLYEYFFDNRIIRFTVTEFIFPIFPILVGCYCLFISLKKGFVLMLISKQKSTQLPIEDLNKKLQLDELRTFFNENNFTKEKFTA